MVQAKNAKPEEDFIKRESASFHLYQALTQHMIMHEAV
jgi:hypothetical protein